MDLPWLGAESVLRIAVMLSLGVMLAAMAQGAEPGALKESAGGGWETTGLPYTARVSSAGYLELLDVDGFAFVATGADGSPHGVYLADGDTALPFTVVAAQADAVIAECEQGRVTMRFLPDGLQFTVQNRSISGGHCLRMDVTRDLARVKTAGRGVEYELPLRAGVRTPAKMIAASGAGLLFGEARSYDLHSSGYIVAGPRGYVVKFPYVRAGTTKTFKVLVETEPQPEDAVKVEFSMPREDHTFWSDGPQQLKTLLTNADADRRFRGEVLLGVRSYLTKQVARELKQRISLTGGEAKELTWEVSGLEPMLYIAELRVRSGDDGGLSAAPRFVFNASGLLPPPVPDDFDDFWGRTLAEQAKIPLDLQIAKVRDEGEHEVYKFSFAGLLGYRCYGWLTLPKDKSRKWPAVLALPPAGMRSQPVPIYKDAVGMRININTADVDLQPDDYDWRTWPAPYLVNGILDRDYYCLRFGYAATARAAEVLAARPEVDPGHVRVTGSSQGGGLAFIAAGLYPGFESAEAIKPGLCRLDWNLDYLQPPYFPIAVNDYCRSEIAQTLEYFLPSHFARRITCPISVSFALHDDVTPAVGVFCAYNAIPGTNKTIHVDASGGH